MFLYVYWMMCIVVVRMDIIALNFFYIVNVYTVINYSSFVYCDGRKRLVPFLCIIMML